MAATRFTTQLLINGHSVAGEGRAEPILNPCTGEPLCEVRILESHPDVLVKGGDWAVDKIVGGKEVTAWGGKVVSIPFIHARSTTALLQKIRSL